MTNQITVSDWLTLTSETREKLRKILGVPKSASTIVESDQFGKSKVMSDGCTNADLQSITVQKLMDYLDGDFTPEDTLNTLFEKAIAKLEAKPKKLPEASVGVLGMFKCEFCEYATANKRALRGHVMGKHKNR